MEFALYMLIGTVGSAIYAVCLCGGLAVLKRRDLDREAPEGRA